MNYPTWSDLNKESVVPVLGARKAPDIGPVAIMISCKPDLGLIKTRCGSFRTISFFNSSLIIPDADFQGTSISGPFIGAPYAAMLLESLIARGARKIIVLGWCGAVVETLNPGDIVLPSKAIADEGTSANYIRIDKYPGISRPDLELSEKLAFYMGEQGTEFKKAVIWTTDAIYRETRDKIARFRAFGADAVEMECSALFSVASFRGVEIAAVLVVSDSVASKNWDPGFKKQQFKNARAKACDIIMNFAGKILHDNG
jgi:uridine phosphorylase